MRWLGRENGRMWLRREIVVAGLSPLVKQPINKLKLYNSGNENENCGLSCILRNVVIFPQGFELFHCSSKLKDFKLVWKKKKKWFIVNVDSGLHIWLGFVFRPVMLGWLCSGKVRSVLVRLGQACRSCQVRSGGVRISRIEQQCTYWSIPWFHDLVGVSPLLLSLLYFYNKTI